ncbi:MAG TPA: hypothetical protein PLV25_03445, partial [Opitutales bacterium]|nr:hypothetical protein [Opitutales bacterium]
ARMIRLWVVLVFASSPSIGYGGLGDLYDDPLGIIVSLVLGGFLRTEFVLVPPTPPPPVLPSTPSTTSIDSLDLDGDDDGPIWDNTPSLPDPFILDTYCIWGNPRAPINAAIGQAHEAWQRSHWPRVSAVLMDVAYMLGTPTMAQMRTAMHSLPDAGSWRALSKAMSAFSSDCRRNPPAYNELTVLVILQYCRSLSRADSLPVCMVAPLLKLLADIAWGRLGPIDESYSQLAADSMVELLRSSVRQYRGCVCLEALKVWIDFFEHNRDLWARPNPEGLIQSDH